MFHSLQNSDAPSVQLRFLFHILHDSDAPVVQ